MRHILGMAVLLLAAAAFADDKVAEQKKTAEANWEAVGAGEFARHETKHFQIYAPKAMEKKLKELGTLLEKEYDLAAGVVKYGSKTDPWPGKLTVYLFAERDHMTAFLRRVDKRRPEAEDTGSYSATDEALHVAAGPPRDKKGLAQETQAAELAAGVVLVRKLGKDGELPDWLVSGFGRATYYRAAPTDKGVAVERRKAATLSRKHGPRDVWTSGSLETEQAGPLRASLADFLAYGPGAAKFPAFVDGFKSAENMPKKTTEQALDAAGLRAETVETTWKAWVLAPR
jgi:hypothetical protein